MKTINIHGKKYVPVSERLIYFRENYKDWSLTSKILELDEKRCVIISTVKDLEGRKIATGIAYEILGSTNVNKTSFIENCETSANGRALGNLGIMIEDNICSADEVFNAKAQDFKKAKTQTLNDSKFQAMIIAIAEGNSEQVKKRMSSYIMTEKQKTELNRLLTEAEQASQIIKK